MTEHEIEPVRGLPGQLPPGERILWQGSPAPLALARSAFHARGVAIYFALLTAVALGFALSRGTGLLGVGLTAAGGVAGVGLLHLLGWAAARSTVYSLTDRRIVLRIGIALPKCVNLPLSKISAVDLSTGGDIVLRPAEAPPLGWLALWPHARPWRLARAEPMLRGIPDAQAVAARIARACLAVHPDGRLVSAPGPLTLAPDALPEAVAA